MYNNKNIQNFKVRDNYLMQSEKDSWNNYNAAFFYLPVESKAKKYMKFCHILLFYVKNYSTEKNKKKDN